MISIEHTRGVAFIELNASPVDALGSARGRWSQERAGGLSSMSIWPAMNMTGKTLSLKSATTEKDIETLPLLEHYPTTGIKMLI